MSKLIVESGKVRISDFEMKFVEDEGSFEFGWLHCFVEILDDEILDDDGDVDDDGDIVRNFEVKCGVEFGYSGGSLSNSPFNKNVEIRAESELDKAVISALEQYLALPAVAEELAEIYEEGLQLAEEERERAESENA